MSDIQGFRGGKIAEGRAMWESPITQISTQLEQKMHEEEDKLVIEVSRIIGYDINKEELIKAMNYSQEQFAKGYAKGHEIGYETGYAKAISDFAEKIKTEIEDIPNNESTKPVGTYDYVMGATNERRIILEIIDKYRGE